MLRLHAAATNALGTGAVEAATATAASRSLASEVGKAWGKLGSQEVHMYRIKDCLPFASKRSAMLRPVAQSGSSRVCAASAFATSLPPTAGSTNGVMPRRTGSDGRFGSEQMDGMETAKGLKFWEQGSGCGLLEPR